jgi:CheY-like chemotaxis protein
MNAPLALLVDDDADAAAMMRRTLTVAGFTGPLATMTTGAAALRFLELTADVPKLIFVDLMLPDQHGFELIREIRARPGGETPLIAVLSASRHPADVAGGFSVGATCYFDKYPSPQQLRPLVERALQP